MLSNKEELKIITKNLFCVNAYIDSSDEALSKSFCIMYIRLLEQAFEYVNQVKGSQKILRSAFISHNVKVEHEINFPDNSTYTVKELIYIKYEPMNDEPTSVSKK